ncbi:MAG: hypothetical protein U0637_12315 [Phycisphaerales bacterium]
MKRLAALASTIALISVAAAQQGDKPQKEPNVPAGHPSIPMPEVSKNWPQAKPEDVSSVDAIIKAFYEVPAGEAGKARDWDRYLSLFVPDARLIVARSGENGSAGTIFLAVPDYVAANRTYFEKGGFMDKEVARRSESFANMVQVWSTYESRRSANDAAPYLRGINSIQLLKDGNRYWIVNVFWDNETQDVKIPEKYLTSPAN